MSGRGGKKSKAQIQASKPEPPPFLQRIREQIVASEDADRRERSDKRRLERPNRSTDDGDNDPTIVKLSNEDLTEAEYKRMKTELETKYKLDGGRESKSHNDLDIDLLIQSRHVIEGDKAAAGAATGSGSSTRSEDRRTKRHDDRRERNTKPPSNETVSNPGGVQSASSKDLKTSKKVGGGNKKLSYGSSSEDDDE